MHITCSCIPCEAKRVLLFYSYQVQFEVLFIIADLFCSTFEIILYFSTTVLLQWLLLFPVLCILIFTKLYQCVISDIINRRNDNIGKTGSSNESPWVYGSLLHKDRKSEDSGQKQEWQKTRWVQTNIYGGHVIIQYFDKRPFQGSQQKSNRYNYEKWIRNIEFACWSPLSRKVQTKCRTFLLRESQIVKSM